MALIYRPEIDGLRTLAVVPVVLFHAGVPGITGGYVGVDVFFVISGFLITAIIAREIENGTFSILSFYERRARRILPALTMVVLATLAGALLVQTPPRLEETAVSATAAAAFLSNVYFFLQLDYFGVAAEYRPLLHTWSLAVEEQFYLIWPVLLILLGAARLRVRAVLVVAVLISSFVLSVWATSAYPGFSFYLLPTRAWELMLGAALALRMVPAPRSRGLAEIGGILGLALIAYAVFVFDKSTVFPGVAALVPCLGAALIIWTGGSTWVGRLLSLRPIVFIGLVSYSYYLWHWPPLALLRTVNGSTDLPLMQALAISLLTFGLAVLSWRFVERPFRNPKTLGRGAILSLGAVSIVVLMGLGTTIKLLDGLSERFDRDLLAVYQISQSNKQVGPRCAGRAPEDGLCRIGERSRLPTVLMWGDSHAGAAFGGVDVTLSDAGVSGVAAWHFGCPPIPALRRITDWQSCAAFNDSTLALLNETETTIDTVLLVGRWALTATGERAPGEAGAPAPMRFRDDTPVPDQAVAFEVGLTQLIDELTASGFRVIVLGGIPEIGRHVPDQWLIRAQLGLGDIPAPDLEDVQHRNASSQPVLVDLAIRENVDFVPTFDAFCDPNCVTVHEGIPVYLDDDHLSHHGSITFLPPLLQPFFHGPDGYVPAAEASETPLSYWYPD